MAVHRMDFLVSQHQDALIREAREQRLAHESRRATSRTDAQRAAPTSWSCRPHSRSRDMTCTPITCTGITSVTTRSGTGVARQAG